MRQSLRRLKASVETIDAAAATASAETGGSLTALASALAGVTGGRSSATFSSGNGAAAVAAAISSDVIKGAAPPRKVKKLRYSFNSNLRETRLAEGLEDLTDDEDEQRMGIVEEDEGGDVYNQAVVHPVSGVFHTDAATGDVVEEAGAKKAAHRALPKALNHITDATFRDGCAGMYDSDPVLARRKDAHRKSGKKKPGKNTAANAATTPHDFSSGGGGGGGGAKAQYRFWGASDGR
jgi:hypothetical protein